ncbi:alpha/beta hydrolase [Pseudoalteromonas sp. GCY]|uniref:alpha/beta hydrolase n=1 Tax=Pseudoalteromonas sp. GCY TaxID=2003316 RepID=UPI000BFEE9F1|nr:alpha/beta hydrolase [Pseudoalteromonas sp. GCY]PHI37749.1 alpha/beta hydrolase [Pseudoalteromonas sp. GCY]QQQ68660.1 alpha/beta hydrolase [Pseudoalteromonas sp. GCY]
MKTITSAVLGLVAVSSVASANQETHQDNYQFVELNGNKLAYACKGEGETTALLLAGMGLDAHETYKNTFHNAEPKGYRLCFYDRAGTGKSTFAKPRVRTILELTDELEAFTKATEMDKLVLVPHSFGGFVARAYANRNPEKVKGMVLIDIAHESWYQDMKSKMSKAGWKIMDWIINWERNTHSLEDFEEASSHTAMYKISRKMPVTILSRGIPHVSIRSAGMSYADVDIYTQTWNDAQIKLQKIGDNVTPITMEYASHLFDETDPFIAIKYIEEMVSKVK